MRTAVAHHVRQEVHVDEDFIGTRAVECVKPYAEEMLVVDH
jgi:hypothetical protein